MGLSSMLTNIVELIELLLFYLYGKIKKNEKFTTVCKVDYTYKYHTTNTAKKIKEGDITLQSHRHCVNVVQSNITFLFLLFYLCDIYMYSRPYMPL